MKRALITGITSQDGQYLTEYLLRKDYVVHGFVRRQNGLDAKQLDADRKKIKDRLFFHEADMADGSNFGELFTAIRPDEVYNLAAQSHVQVSFEKPALTARINALGVVHLLEAVRALDQGVRFFQASSGAMLRVDGNGPQNENSPFHPQSPYACSKVFAHHQVACYREAFGMFACCGILYNHESPRRRENFVTRKISRAAARIKLGMQDKLSLGNIDSRRDWGFAGDYVRAMHMMLQQDKADDFVIATGRTHSVRDFLDISFGRLGLDWESYVEIDPRFYRPAEAQVPTGDPAKARKLLDWEPKVSFARLVEMMVDHDLAEAQKESDATGRKPEST